MDEDIFPPHNDYYEDPDWYDDYFDGYADEEDYDDECWDDDFEDYSNWGNL